MARGRIRILVGVDFSRESLGALRAARTLAGMVGGHITLTHVRPTSNMRAAVVEERGDLLRRPPAGLSAAMADHYARRLAGLRRPGSKEEVLLLRGVAAPALCREARRGHDLMSWETGGEAASRLSSSAARSRRRSPVPRSPWS